MPFESEFPAQFPDHLRWRTIPIPRPMPLYAFVAGPMVGIWAHNNQFIKASKPCLKWITAGKLDCPACGHASLRQIVYLPCFVEKTWDRRVLILSKTTCQGMRDAQFGDRFSAQQDPTPNQPAVVKPVEGRNVTDVLHPRIRNRGPQDIRLYLIHLWGIEQLKEFPFGDEQQAA